MPVANLEEYCERDHHYFYRKWYSSKGRYGLVQEPLQGEDDEPLELSSRSDPYQVGTYPRQEVISEEAYRLHHADVLAKLTPISDVDAAPLIADKDGTHGQHNGEVFYKSNDFEDK